jgi:hypothetical protein
MLGISLAFTLMFIVLGAVGVYKWALKSTHIDEGEGPHVRTLKGGPVNAPVRRVRTRPAKG